MIINEFSYKVYQKEYYKFLNITEKYINHRKTIHIEIEFAKPIIAFDAQLAFSSYRDKNTPLLLFNVTLNGCQTLNTAVKNRAFKIITNSLQYGKTNFPKRCPIQSVSLIE